MISGHGIRGSGRIITDKIMSENENIKLIKVTLSIDQAEWDECKTNLEREDLMYFHWVNWSKNFINVEL